jgi:cytochrome oxidase Cu insertion factor (SCO1/SenC/PrrC family)
VAATAVVLVGAVPMASASMNPNADPILAVAEDGTPNFVNEPAPTFNLVNQRGQAVSLRTLRGRTVALTFLDPVCTSDCPLIAQEFRQAAALLGGDAPHVEFVAIVDNPIYRSVAVMSAFDRQEGLDHMSNWLYLTGTVSALGRVWNEYGMPTVVYGAGAMVAHGELTYIIDGHGRTREVLSTVPGPDTSSKSSFAVFLSHELERVLHA